MCLIFFALKQHPNYKLILAGNRDEFYNRKTSPAGFWSEHPNLLAGRDLEAMGTWLGTTTTGKISTLTNYRDPANINPAAPSRGKLVSDFLTSDVDADAYMRGVASRGHHYNGFNLLAGDADALWYYSNYGNGISKLTEGFFGLSNHLLDTPWPKVKRGKERFISMVKANVLDPDKIFEFLYNAELAPDDQLPNTGLPLERERALSSMFIKSPGYGSRSSTVLLVDNQNNVSFVERVFDTETFEYATQSFSFQVTN